ncbi:MAG: hypothetical protein ACF8Q5_02335 [Phycisphaerales bacterium JB040]
MTAPAEPPAHGVHDAADGDGPGGGSPIAWGAYLGVSWTWCIGMFLPVLLVRDYGLWGFVVFAVPNCLGAAAMGWALRDAGASRRFVEHNAGAVYAFSAITIAFHVYWLTWLATFILPMTGSGYPGVVPALVGALGLALWMTPDRSDTHRLASIALWAASGALLVAFLLTGGAAPGGPIEPPTRDFFETTEPMGRDLLALAPVCVFGFALCPYLDATFHRARQGTTPAGARVAFGTGFLVFFASMIVLTLVYAGPFIASFDRDISTVPGLAPWAAALLMAHLACQLVFTCRVHQHASRPLEQRVPGVLAGIGRALPVLAAALGVSTLFLPALLDMIAGELFYRCFIAAYGLVLPAYVWICAIPTRDGHSGLTGPRGRFKATMLALSVLIATPMYFIGYILLEEWWLWPGLGVLLLARLPVTLRARKGER